RAPGQGPRRRPLRSADPALDRLGDEVREAMRTLPCVGRRSRTSPTGVGPRPRGIPACEREPEAPPDPGAAGARVVHGRSPTVARPGPTVREVNRRNPAPSRVTPVVP